MTTLADIPSPPLKIDPDIFYPVVSAAPLVFCAPSTLDTLRSRGGGPRYTKRGRLVLYRGQALIDWLSGGPEFASTSQGTRPKNAMGAAHAAKAAKRNLVGRAR